MDKLRLPWEKKLRFLGSKALTTPLTPPFRQHFATGIKQDLLEMLLLAQTWFCHCSQAKCGYKQHVSPLNPTFLIPQRC